MNDAPYVLTFGETMALMRTDQVGPLAHTSTLSLGIGGSESNVAIGLQRLGVQAVWCGRVGADSLGSLVEREIRAEGVDVRTVIDPWAPTGLMIKERRTPATQRVSYYRSGSAGSRITPENIDEQLVSGAALLHVTGITPALSPEAASTLRHAVEGARAHHVTVSFDLNYRGNLWSPESARSVYRDIIPLADIVFAGEDEAVIAVGAGDPEELARRISALGPRQAVIKLGADGAIALIQDTIFRQSAVTVDTVDTVGAGDAFVAGYLAEFVTGRGPQERLNTAAATGAFACLVPGDWEGLPRRHELPMLQTREPVSR
ncbi:sugar kinase [Arthrobacter sp. SLBN-112]|uniref:sugar kinase n=1 Tax=Arthrobacter sp. SLBN-112 TaxID=2768452 RepID=UPI0027B2A25F|nr:sugar kinase [Arthrobacter sp. SLBN-112]MDQ0801383.1 2-dehydro-3-deoxygluconokinase [Arthrobacter sp. SLBN-112]